MRMQPTMGGPGVLANGVEAGPHVTRAVARWLESHNVQQYHQGLLVAVLISCGLWRDSMWEPLENGALRCVCWALLHLRDKGLAWLLAVRVHAPFQMVPGTLCSPREADGQAAALVVAILGSGQLPGSLQLHALTPPSTHVCCLLLPGCLVRATFNTYKSVWSEACLQTWKDNITTKQALLTALSTGRQQLLSMHILWSLQELCTHCGQLQNVLPEVATPIELGLMQKLRQKGGAGQGWALGVTGAPVGGGESAAAAQCAVLLQRWLAAANGKW